MSKIKTPYNNSLSYYKIAYFLKDYINKDTLIVCIGTDRCIGDSLGPLVGSMLRSKNFPLHVYGTIDNPIHALNIEEKISQIKNRHPNSNIIGIDACLGDKCKIGELQVRDYPVHPGKGVGKSLPNIGEVSIIGIVDSHENNELFHSNTIRLSLIMNMAKTIVNSLLHCYYMVYNEPE
ncbi:spore protease YyaC [Clostridium oceanicum]|uniref:Spore protease YyaC n=1 Tax=Clostridium oceanicum TaxID=1543 RepID=A0ABN1JPX8_9CLOT